MGKGHYLLVTWKVSWRAESWIVVRKPAGTWHVKEEALSERRRGFEVRSSKHVSYTCVT